MSVTVAKLVGISSPYRWSQVHVHFPQGNQGRLGLLTAVVTMEAEEGASGELAAVGTEVIQRLHEEYYGNSAEVGLDRLKKAVGAVKDEFGEGIAALGAVTLLPAPKQWVCYGVVLGKTVLQLVRKGEVVPLLQPGASGGISGYLDQGDGLMLGTQALLDTVNQAQWLDGWLKARGDVDGWVDYLNPKVHASESSGVAGVFVGVYAVKTRESEVLVPKVNLSGKKTGMMVGSWAKARWVGLVRWWEGLRGFRGGQRELYVGNDEERRRRMLAAVGAVVGLMLLVSVVFGFVRQRTSEAALRLNETRANVDRLVSEIQQLSDLNPLRARMLVTQAQQVLDEYKNSEQVSREGQGWLEQTRVALDNIQNGVMKIYELGKPGVFMDLGLVREGSAGKMMDFDGDYVAVWDESAKVVLAVAVPSKKAMVVGGALLPGGNLVAVWAGRGFVLAFGGVVELDIERKTSAVALKRDSAWGEIGAMDVFGGNLYLLDKSEGQIYRYTAAASGFGPRRDWLGRGVRPDFSQVVSMVIDGNIWILTKTGKVEVYSLGTGRAVELTGLDRPLEEPKAIYTDEESKHVYILDGGDQRVVVFSKEGMYEAQYKWAETGEVTDMVVSEKEKKILLLAGSVIYNLELR